MKCGKCNERESTGIVVVLCDPCFDEWEASVQARKEAGAVDADGKVPISDGEAAMLGFGKAGVSS